MNGSEIKKHLYSLVNKGIKYDLDRMIAAANSINNPQTFYKSFHVAGTNGKGSTCSFIESVLRASGFKTGLYTSPHILRFEERFRVNGEIVTEDKWLSVYKDIHDKLDIYNLTFFEASTLIAFELFKRENVDWAVFETGLGGRLDATNIIMPQVSVITRIAMDHMDLLGNTLADIAKEKFGIIKKDTSVVCAENSDPSIMDLFKQTCNSRNAPFRIVELSDANTTSQCENGVSFIWKNENFKLRLNGTFQVLNALVALEALEEAGLNNPEFARIGIETAFIPGRFQNIIYKNRPFIIDVGHNPDAADILVSNLKKRYPQKSICFITGIMKDKDFEKVINKYLQIATGVILTRPQIERAASVELLLNAVPPALKNKCRIIESIPDAIDSSFKENFDIICIAGSFHTVGEACEHMKLNLEPDLAE